MLAFSVNAGHLLTLAIVGLVAVLFLHGMNHNTKCMTLAIVGLLLLLCPLSGFPHGFLSRWHGLYSTRYLIPLSIVWLFSLVAVYPV